MTVLGALWVTSREPHMMQLSVGGERKRVWGWPYCREDLQRILWDGDPSIPFSLHKASVKSLSNETSCKGSTSSFNSMLAAKITLRCESCLLNYRQVATVPHNYYSAKLWAECWCWIVLQTWSVWVWKHRILLLRRWNSSLCSGQQSVLCGQSLMLWDLVFLSVSFWRGTHGWTEGTSLIRSFSCIGTMLGSVLRQLQKHTMRWFVLQTTTMPDVYKVFSKNTHFCKQMKVSGCGLQLRLWTLTEWT